MVYPADFQVYRGRLEGTIEAAFSRSSARGDLDHIARRPGHLPGYVMAVT
jgi:hypothetical protein